MDETVKLLIQYFKEAGKAHHLAFESVNGVDAEWPIWYSDFLFEKVAPLLKDLTKSNLIYYLIVLDKKMKEEKPSISWPEYYANYLITEFS